MKTILRLDPPTVPTGHAEPVVAFVAHMTDGTTQHLALRIADLSLMVEFFAGTSELLDKMGFPAARGGTQGVPKPITVHDLALWDIPASPEFPANTALELRLAGARLAFALPSGRLRSIADAIDALERKVVAFRGSSARPKRPQEPN